MLLSFISPTSAVRDHLELDAAIERVARIVFSTADQILGRSDAIGDHPFRQSRSHGLYPVLHGLRAQHGEAPVERLRAGRTRVPDELHASPGPGAALRNLLDPHRIRRAGAIRELSRARPEQE